jgi:integrase
MARAGVPRVGPTGGKRSFHSFRHSFAKTALENGASLAWLSRHLGHSRTLITDRIYGHYEAAQRRRQMQLLDGVFGIEQSARTTTVRAGPAALPLEETESSLWRGFP